jgi:hypothetical protein
MVLFECIRDRGHQQGMSRSLHGQVAVHATVINGRCGPCCSIVLTGITVNLVANHFANFRRSELFAANLATWIFHGKKLDTDGADELSNAG